MVMPPPSEWAFVLESDLWDACRRLDLGSAAG